MHILGHLDRYGPPVGGGVVTTVTVLRELAKRGHDVHILTDREATLRVPDIPITSSPSGQEYRDAYRWAELVVPHMKSTPAALKLARRHRKPIMYPVHDDEQLEHYGVQPNDAALVLFFANGLRERTRWAGNTFVVHPPTFVTEHRVKPIGDAITISSLSPEKGGELFWELVHRLPDRQFIGVRGGWGDQIIPVNLPRNVEIIDHQGTDMRNVFRRTRILLVPSQRLEEGRTYWTENWGRVAVEAAASGIPVIANPAPGPLEALGTNGIFRDRTRPDDWIEAISSLDDPEIYRCYSAAVRQRAEELDLIVTSQLDELAQMLAELAPVTEVSKLGTLNEASP